ncbi:NAD(P)-binding domain-containing protein [Pseudoalteromonas sp. MMG013]|uniref:NAD(P)-binding domain-containing protein n=1 Tax=Pseudoalteromonas sp. MMG013 TaxID=2822687 RepID=UPI001B39390A|nr:NAD(P)-binding domain-containing protein [Pseudoalteromonas sp. MMG013]MBQ4860074.1 NAD(P)-binding domain-containing protein [Pseudoalteromonas sp. MMG013]
MDKKQKTDPTLYDVCVVGAGWSGLMACKYALENGLSVIVFEQRAHLGGIWNYSQDPNVVSVATSAAIPSPAYLTEACDFYLSPETSDLLNKSQIIKYLNDYARHFNLLPHIKFNETVIHTTNENNWLVTTQSATIKAKNLVVSGGANAITPSRPRELRDFEGKVEHLGHIKEYKNHHMYSKERILLYGNEGLAIDTLKFLATSTHTLTCSIPKQYTCFSAINLTQPDDISLHQEIHACALNKASQYSTDTLSRWLNTATSTLKLWINKCRYTSQLKKTTAIPKYDANINCKDAIHSSIGQSVKFYSGETRYFDRIILCTGYTYQLSFLPKKYAYKARNQCYKSVFDCQDPSLIFIGSVRPCVGTLPLISELQCRWAFKILSGKKYLPSLPRMQNQINFDNQFWSRYINRQANSDTLVEPYTYCKQIAHLSGDNPDYRKLFIQSPYAFVTTCLSPISSAHFAIKDKKTRDGAIAQICARRRARGGLFLLCTIFRKIIRHKWQVELSTKRATKNHSP